MRRQATVTRGRNRCVGTTFAIGEHCLTAPRGLFLFVIHLVFFLGQFVSLHGFSASRLRPVTPLEVIYESDTLHRKLQHLEEQLVRAKRDTALAPLTAASLSDHTQIRIPERPALTADTTVSPLMMPGRAPVVDLANLADASGGNPVLLSYFGVIRDQIQRTANNRAWSTGDTTEGLVYVSFVLTATGSVHSVAILSDKSVPSDRLQDISLRIVKTAAPFPPFPPSIQEPSKNVIVPLEFLLGS